MKTWRIPVVWQEFGVIKVEADTLSEAMKIAKDDDGVIPLPEGDYIDDSWELAYKDEQYIREAYNSGKDDIKE